MAHPDHGRIHGHIADFREKCRSVGIGHAPTRGVSVAAAQAHYDNVEACWALGRISEHRLWIYFSGIVAPWAPSEKVQMGLASPVSGDWRPIGPRNNLELVAVLSVNTPGFLCKTETDDTGRPLAMVASMGAVALSDSGAPGLSLDDVKRAVQEAITETNAAAVLAARVDEVAARALAAVGVPLSATERMGQLIAERAEFGDGIDNVVDAEYWGRPVGTPITRGMKPARRRAGSRGGGSNKRKSPRFP